MSKVKHHLRTFSYILATKKYVRSIPVGVSHTMVHFSQLWTHDHSYFLSNRPGGTVFDRGMRIFTHLSQNRAFDEGVQERHREGRGASVGNGLLFTPSNAQGVTNARAMASARC